MAVKDVALLVHVQIVEEVLQVLFPVEFYLQRALLLGAATFTFRLRYSPTASWASS